jgi:Uma2 family endonuclease
MRREQPKEEGMSTVRKTPPGPETFADLLAQIGDVPPERIRMRPPPGTATEADVIDSLRHPEGRLFELVDGVLVEKAVRACEALLALALGRFLLNFLDEHDLGVAVGADGFLRLFPGSVRAADVAFISWDKLPAGKLPDAPVPDLFPDLVVEVLSVGNTRAEMERKRRDYFHAGVRVVWEIQAKTQTAVIYSSPTTGRRIPRTGSLTGGEVLPGFVLPLATLFASGVRRGGPRRKS